MGSLWLRVFKKKEFIYLKIKFIFYITLNAKFKKGVFSWKKERVGPLELAK